MNILIVDDERDICDFLSDFLRQEGHEVNTLCDPTKALEDIKHNAYHLIILDIMMPKLSGMDLLGQIRTFDEDVSIVILTGYPSVETAADSIGYGVSAYLKKPFSIDDLRTILFKIAQKKGLLLEKEGELHRIIGDSIRRMRKSKGLTLKQLARRTQLSISLLSQIERGESSPSISSLYKIAIALSMKMAQLFGDF
ncbi:response regulator [Myxococcota bacterium]|jgi:DNA-binding response OmpR family regulator|nr:response regulator [Myxococcota bacterium]MBU1413799.1 response regulator [Myxococcota bacterium]MBU1508839.1 response regulator [Myxococcota bacterium]PKN24684.1 MAG: two-component system response regulator [Deltaproteobacteria bacterium HGW-Deltaproteobacteria-22]